MADRRQRSPISMAGRPKTGDRAEVQRDRILNAAERCFIERGFHAASMATIADTAGMSAGLIYRYFDSKNAIILAIIARQLEEKSRNIAALHSEQELGERILKLFAGWQARDASVMNVALFLEMSALATRDPQIAAAVAASDRISSQQFGDWMRRQAAARGEPLADKEAAARMLLLQCFIEGLSIRAVREPDYDPGVVADAIRMLPGLLK